ncbi:MAG: hypothetical protein ACF8CQ_23175 [Rhodopirellula sp. JB044]|uniref:hypothetical protein n=1 Tax=Rhodopirellula sp. JB044 TaxID=3342844 RepID=UPI00370C7860
MALNEPSQTLDISAFKHVIVPIGVVIGLGVARIVVSVSQYVSRWERVRFSSVHALWSFSLFLMLVGLWWIIWGLRFVDAERWSFFTLIYLLAGPVLLFLPSIILLPDVPQDGELDLGSVVEEAARTLFLCLAAFLLWLAFTQIYLIRESFLVPHRVGQAMALVVLLIGAMFPSRRMAAVVGVMLLALLVATLATVRASLY